MTVNLLVQHEAPTISHFNHMSDPMILAHKAATGFEGGSYHITLRGILQSSIQPLGIAVHGIHLIGVAEDLHHQGLA